MRRGIGRLRAGGSGFSPSSLFAAGEQGGWYDPSDISSMFSDSAGTTPATVEGPVGKINDKSGRGNHLIQATAASRPTLSARYNRLTKTQVFSDAAWTKQASVAVTDNTVVAPDGTMTGATVTWGAAAINTGIFQQIGGLLWTGLSNKKSIYVRADTAGGTVDLVDSGLTSGTTTLTLSTSWQQVSLTEAAQTNSAGPWLRKTASTPATVYIWGGDIRLAADAALNIPTYQRVDTASSYDTSGFPMYLLTDGVDDGMASAATVDLSGTSKLTVWVGITKSTDVSGMVVELTASGGATIGGFYIDAPESTTNPGFIITGASGSGGGWTSAMPAAPASRVLTLAADFAGVNTTQAVKPYVNGVLTQTATLGGAVAMVGPFANATLYVGRRGGTTLPFNGRIYQMIIRGAATTDLTAGNTYVGAKMGLAL